MYQDLIRHRHCFQLKRDMLESKMGNKIFTNVWERWNGLFFELGTYEVRIYLDSVRQRHYYQLTSGILESVTGELGFLPTPERGKSDPF